MQRFIAWQLIAAWLVVGSISGCARTVVRKVTRGDEQGVRFYRPKPYLKITPSANKADTVTIDVAYLPDFSEEYTARPFTGLGTNDTEVQLYENGTLKSFNSKTDAKFDENLEAIASLLKAAPTSASPRGYPNPENKNDDNVRMEIRAYGVPLGLYEAVVSRGPDGCKRLYGWRYVGFAPFAQCPYQATGLDCKNCNETLYGLVNLGGTMVFCALDELAANPTAIQARFAAIGTAIPNTDSDSRAAQAFAENYIALAKQNNIHVAAEKLHVLFGQGTVTLIVRGTMPAEQTTLRSLAEQEVRESIPGAQVFVHFEP